MEEKKLPPRGKIASVLRPLGAVGRSLLSFLGVEEGRLRPRAAAMGGLLAFLALAAFLWRGGQPTQASYPGGTTLTIDQQVISPAGVPNVNAGDIPEGTIIRYTVTLTIPAGPSSGNNAYVEVDLDDVLTGVTVTSTGGDFVPAALCTINPITNVVRCNAAGPDTDFDPGNHTITIRATVRLPSGGAGTVIPLADAQAYDVSGPAGLTPGFGTGDGPYRVTAVVDPDAATNFVGVPETYTFTLQGFVDGAGNTIWYTCANDPLPGDGSLSCVPGDVVVTGPLTVNSVVVTDNDLSDLEGVVQVTVTPTGPGTGTVALNLVRARCDPADATPTPPCDDPSLLIVEPFPSPVAQKTGVTSAGAVVIAVPDPDHWNVIGSDHTLCVTPPTGHSWDGDEVVTITHISTQFGANWTQTSDAFLSGGLICVTATSTMPGEWTGATIEVFDPDLGGTVVASGTFVKEWSNLVDSAVMIAVGTGAYPDITDLPAGVDPDDVNWQHSVSIENQTITWPVDRPLPIVEVSHGEHMTLGGPVHVPVDHAVVVVNVNSPRGCTSATVLSGSTTGAVNPNDFNPALPYVEFEHGAALILIEATCEELATITIREDYPRPVSSVFRPVVQQFRVNWITHEVAKQPLIYKAGEKVVLELIHPQIGPVSGVDNEDDAIAACQRAASQWPETTPPVNWVLEGESPGELEAHEPGEVQVSHSNVWEQAPADAVPIGDDEWACVFDVIVHSEDPGQVDVTALLQDSDGNQIGDRHFVIWFVKLYSVSTTFVPGTLFDRVEAGVPVGVGFDDDGDGVVEVGEAIWRPEPAVFGDASGALPATDSRLERRVVSDHALVRVQVKDFIYLANRSARPDTCLDMDGDGNGTAGAAPGPYPATTHTGCPDPDDEMVEGGYWVLPDDFARLAGFLPSLMRAEWDALFGPTDPNAGDLAGVGPVLVGPKRVIEHELGFAFYCYDLPGALRARWGTAIDFTGADCVSSPNGADEVGLFQSIQPNFPWPNALVNIWDAIMPLEKVTLSIPDVAGLRSGLLLGVQKGVVYASGTNPYYQVNIPANDDVPFTDGSGGYDWNSSTEGPYPFWEPLQWLRPGKAMQLYTDNHGEAMALVLGDRDLTFDECARNAITGAPECSRGDVVGRTAVVAVVDYPYHRGKHRDMRSAPAIETWTWGGYKSGVDAGDPDLPAALRSPEIVPTDNPSFKYLVVHLKDRDGRCDNPWPGQIDPRPGRNGVRNEPIDFRIDSAVGRIIDSALDGTISADGKTALGVRTGRVFSGAPRADDDFDAAGERHFTPFEEGECQAWILIQNSTNEPTNVSITYHDPEGDIVIDVLVPGVGTPRLFGDVDCSGEVNAVDALKVLRHVVGLEVSQTEPCPDIGSTVTVDGVPRKWGDVDGDGDVDAVDALKILRHVAGLSVSQEPGTPPIGSTVRVS